MAEDENSDIKRKSKGFLQSNSAQMDSAWTLLLHSIKFIKTGSSREREAVTERAREVDWQKKREQERELLCFNNSWWSFVIHAGSITTLHLPDTSSRSALWKSNRSGWLINNHLAGWRGETTTEQWTIKYTLIPSVSLSACFCAGLTVLSVCLSVRLSIAHCEVSFCWSVSPTPPSPHPPTPLSSFFYFF